MDRIDELDTLAREAYYLARQTETLHDIDLAIQRHQQVIDLTPDNDPARAGRVDRLARSFMTRYRQTGVVDDLELGIQRSEEALSLTSVNHPERAVRLQVLAIGYNDRHRHSKASDDIERMIQRSKEAVSLTADDHPERADRLFMFGMAYLQKYIQYGEVLDDLELAIPQLRKAINLTPENHSERAARVNELATAYQARYLQTKDDDDIKVAIQLSREVLDLTSDDNPERALRLHVSATAHQIQYDQTREITDLEQSVQLFQKAVNLTPENHPYSADTLNGLAWGYGDRYKHTGALVDLKLCIQKLEEAVKLTQGNNHDILAIRLQNLAVGYVELYDRTGECTDLEFSIQQGEEAVKIASEGYPGRVNLMNTLAKGYYRRYEQTGALADFELYFQRLQEGINLTTKNHPHRAHLLGNLAAGYRDRFLLTGAIADLKSSIQKGKEAIKLIPESDPFRAHILLILAMSYLDRGLRTKTFNDIGLSFSRACTALTFEKFHPRDRFRAGRFLFDISAQFDMFALAWLVAHCTKSLVPLITPRSSDRSDIQHQVNHIVGLASDAVAVSLRVGMSLFEDIQFLEIGRGVIANSLRNMRTDTTDLKKSYPDLAERLIGLRDVLDGPKDTRKDVERYDTGKQLEDLILQIRSLEGFDRFLLDPNEDETKRAAIHGPIVVINVSQYGCHALITELKGFQVLELSLDIKDVKDQVDKLANPDVEMLEWLWDKVANPVLTALKFVTTPAPGQIWPRVWWILTGPLARFPIHAAGLYSENVDGYSTVMDRVISSYSSSISAIIDARPSFLTPFRSFEGGSMVLVTPDSSQLRYAKEEIKTVAALGTSMQLQVKQPQPCPQETLTAMDGCEIFHFAGHGITDLSNPWKSALVLDNGQLTVDEIFDINLHKFKPFLAYLSACGTGQVKDEKLIDEGLHLIGAFQLAGFRHVIGTLWEVNDESCVDVARLTYKWIQERRLSDDSVSEGLHHACRKLRNHWVKENEMRASARAMRQVKRIPDAVSAQEQSSSAHVETGDQRNIESVEDLPLYWVPYVHYGL